MTFVLSGVHNKVEMEFLEPLLLRKMTPTIPADSIITRGWLNLDSLTFDMETAQHRGCFRQHKPCLSQGAKVVHFYSTADCFRGEAGLYGEA